MPALFGGGPLDDDALRPSATQLERLEPLSGVLFAVSDARSPVATSRRISASPGRERSTGSSADVYARDRDSRGNAKARRSRGRASWLFEAPVGAYAPVPAWSSAARWLHELREHLLTAAGEEHRAQARIAGDTLLRVAAFEAASADGRTGRGVATAHATVAARLGMSAKTVQRCRDLLIKLGFAVEITRGRHLTRAERLKARELHGAHQDRAASVRALTQPRPTEPVENVHPPRRGSVKPLSHVPEMVNNQHAQARAADESPNKTRRAATKGPAGRPRRRHRVWTPWPTDQIEFARALQQRMPALRRYHAATVCRLLHSNGVDPDRWTVPTLLHALELSASNRGGLYFARTDQMRNPLAYIAAVLQNAIDPAAATPLEITRREKLERQRRHELNRAADQARRAEADLPEARAARAAFLALTHPVAPPCANWPDM